MPEAPRRKLIENPKKTYLYHVGLASALLVILLPYVWLTNFTATRLAIVFHAFLYWFFIPIFITLSKKLVKPNQDSSKNIKFLFGLIAEYLGLGFAAVAMIVVFHWLSGEPYRILLSAYLWVALAPVFACYTLVFFYRAYRNQQTRALNLEIANAKAAWQTLSAQVNPHFLFNSLNLLEYLIDTDKEKALVCLANLSELYQKVLVASKIERQSIGKEIEIIDHYLQIQKERFGNRLNYSIDFPDTILSFEIPPAILLNCVENAIKHGVEQSSDKSDLLISGKSLENRYKILIKNPFSETTKNSKGTNFGLDYIRNQLQYAYGGNFKFECNQDGNEMITIIEAPKKWH